MTAQALFPLARLETRRILLHPVSLLGWACLLAGLVVSAVNDMGPRHAHEVVDTLMSFYPGVMLILVGNLVATRDHRAGSGEMLAALPVRARGRTLALLAAAVPPALLGLLLLLGAHAVNVHLERYDGKPHPSIGQFLQGPLTLVGAVVLGVMVARWTTARMAVVLVLVALVAANVWMNAREDNFAYFGPMMGWARWGAYAEAWGGMYAGSPEWRIGYLLGLCTLAALGALLPLVRRPRRVVVAGFAVLGLTALCGALMLP